MILSAPTFDFLTQLLIENKTVFVLQALHREAEQHNNNHPTLKSINHISRSGKPVLNESSSLKLLLLQEFHNTPTGGHANIVKTFSYLNVNVFWEGMKKIFLSSFQHAKLPRN